ncbi:MAG: diacylglycerol kinase family lipid kinase [Phycisphaerae bacterium]|nr:diacylglycerol kinase family lipid kinase [Phycisphaerae bacterium]
MNPNDGYIAYIVNPKAGASSGKDMVREFKDYLSGQKYDVRTSITKSLSHAGQLAHTAVNDSGCAMVVASGGDGTIREVVHGMQGAEIPVLIIPCGTENLLANELGFDERTSTLIKAFEGGCVRPLDLGNAEGRCFTSIAGFGFDADVVKRVMDSRQGHINHMDYFWPIWRTFWGHHFPVFNVTIDDEELFEGRGLVFVGNISRYAVGLQILHRADYGDGLLDLCVFKCTSRPRLAKHSALTLLKVHAGRRDVLYRQGRTIHVSTPEAGVYSQFDGDPGPPLPVTIELIPHAVRMIVPPNARPAGIRTRLMRILG